MKAQQLKELHTKTVEELERELRDFRAEITKQENEWIHGKLKNTNLVRSLKKDMARVLTVLHAKPVVPVVKEEKIEGKVTKTKKEETK